MVSLKALYPNAKLYQHESIIFFIKKQVITRSNAKLNFLT